jgi:hypothetical protein
MRCLLATHLTFAVAVAAATTSIGAHGAADDGPALGPPGLEATYRLAPDESLGSNSVEIITLNLGPVESSGARCQWLALRATKANGQRFAVWILARAFPSRTLEQAATTIVRYILQENNDLPQEFIHRFTGVPVLPSLGGWEYLWPRPQQGDWRGGSAAPQVDWLGLRYALASTSQKAPFPAPREVRKLELLPDALVGVPSNRRTKDDARRFDGSDYEMVRLARENYAEMIRAGLNCFAVDVEQAGWLKDQPVFYWGIGGQDVAFPECLFRSTYLGPALFLDEPAVGTRDYDIRPRLAKDAGLPSRADAADRFGGIQTALSQNRIRGRADGVHERHPVAWRRGPGYHEFSAAQPLLLGDDGRFRSVATDGRTHRRSAGHRV